jgi:hypothetical protein
MRLLGFPHRFDPRNAHWVIATVPDPLHTRMSMETDRYLDAIQHAAFDSGYELATQWLPWTVKAADSRGSADTETQEPVDWEKFPGLLVFRPHFLPYLHNIDDLLFVFVVGETPTAGINGFQFRWARGAISALDAGHARDVYIAGPNFSGSFLSLANLLESSAGTDHIEMRAGSVTNSEYARAMLIHLESKGFHIGPREDRSPSITFHGSTLPSVSFRLHFMELARRLDLRPEEVAEITEDETGFSFIAPEPSQTKPRKPQPTDDEERQAETVIYRYPRDIAQLRNTYNDQSFSTAEPDQKSTQPVDFSLKDTQAGEDAFPIFSTAHTPLSQNAILQQIADRLRHTSVRLVSLSATNVFDTLFLANVLARNCPDIRVVLPSADLLFAQQASHGLLSGVLAISPFPLFAAGSEIMQRGNPPDRSSDLTTFATSDQIGEFNAVFDLLEPFATRQREGYRQKYGPSVNGEFASAWLLVLSSRGWMPVDLLGQENRTLEVNRHSVDWFDARQRPAVPQTALAALLRIGSGWIALCLAVCAFSLAFVDRLIYLLLRPHRRVWSVLCLTDLKKQVTTEDEARILRNRYFCMVSCFVSLAAINGFLLCPMLVFAINKGQAITVHPGAGFVLLLGLSSACALSFLVAAALSVVAAPRSVAAIGLRLLVVFLGLAGLWTWWTCCDNGVTGYMLCFRTFSLSSPVSPIWPLLLIGFGLFAASYFHLRRFTWGDRRRPFLNTSIFDLPLSDAFHHLKDQLDLTLTSIASGRGGVSHYLIVVTALIVVVVGWWCLPARTLGSFEPRVFSVLLRSMVGPLAFCTLLTFFYFTRSWMLLRAFLVNLNSVVLGRYFVRVPEFGGGAGPVWIRGVQLMSLGTAVNSCVALHNLEILQHTPGKYTSSYFSKLRSFLAEDDGKTTRRDFIEQYEQFRQTADQISIQLSTDVLRKYWQYNELPLVGSGCGEPDSNNSETTASAAEKSLPGLTAGKTMALQAMTAAVGSVRTVYVESQVTEGEFEEASPQPAADLPPTEAEYRQAATYVALHYSAYIGYALHQLQNLLVGCVASFVLLVLALNSFSFQAPQALFHFLTAALIIGGVAILAAFAQMERDPILSRLSGTTEGELGKDFFLRALAYGAIPVFTVLSTEFPSLSRYIADWIQPVSAALQ